MRVYGLAIDNTGIEFATVEDRQKAINTFCMGSILKLSTGAGPQYQERDASFRTYDRDTDHNECKCSQCSGLFQLSECSYFNIKTYYESSDSWSGGYQQWACNKCKLTYETKRSEWEALQEKKKAERARDESC